MGPHSKTTKGPPVSPISISKMMTTLIQDITYFHSNCEVVPELNIQSFYWNAKNNCVAKHWWGPRAVAWFAISIVALSRMLPFWKWAIGTGWKKQLFTEFPIIGKQRTFLALIPPFDLPLGVPGIPYAAISFLKLISYTGLTTHSRSWHQVRWQLFYPGHGIASSSWLHSTGLVLYCWKCFAVYSNTFFSSNKCHDHILHL